MLEGESSAKTIWRILALRTARRSRPSRPANAVSFPRSWW